MRFLAIVAAALSVTFAARAQVAGCANDGECKAGRICQAHACVEAPAGERCGRDVDCAGEDLCVERRCMSPGKARAFRSGHHAATPPLPSLPASAPAAPAGQGAGAQPPTQGGAAATPAAPESSPARASSSPAASTPPATAVAPAAAAPAASAASIGSGAGGSSEARGTGFAPSPDAAAPPLVIVQRQTDDGPGQLVYTGAVTLGLARWSVHGSEYDLGFSANAEVGLRAAENLSLVALGNAGYSFLSADYSAVLGSLGAGLRLDHVIPGHVTIGGLASFGSISYGGQDPAQQSAGSISFSGLAVVAQGVFPISGAFGVAAQTTFHTFTNGGSLFTLTVGPSFGN